MARVSLLSWLVSFVFRVISMGLVLLVLFTWLGKVFFPNEIVELGHAIDGIPEHERRLISQLDEVERLLKEQRLTEAKRFLYEVMQASRGLTTLSDTLKVKMYLAKGEVHWQSWQYVDAEQAWDTALQHARTSQRFENVRNRIHRVRKIIEKINAERGSAEFYEAAPNIGPAGTPSGHVVIAQVFLVDGNSTGWSIAQRQFVEASSKRVENWLDSAVERFNKKVRFTRRSFIVDRDPKLKRISIGGSQRDYINSEFAAHRAVEYLGYESIQMFLRQLTKEHNADHAVLLYYINRDDRSFTLPCLQRCRWHTEYAFVYEQARRKRWQAMEYAQAHETLHLFGADDLYRMPGATRFTPRDIMNYYSRSLSDSTIEPITAYAVGLLETSPDVPFKIINYSQESE